VAVRAPPYLLLPWSKALSIHSFGFNTCRLKRRYSLNKYPFTRIVAVQFLLSRNLCRGCTCPFFVKPCKRMTDSWFMNGLLASRVQTPTATPQLITDQLLCRVVFVYCHPVYSLIIQALTCKGSWLSDEMLGRGSIPILTVTVIHSLSKCTTYYMLRLGEKLPIT